jgi:hypothetical protein
MTPSSLRRRLTRNSEQPSRKELIIALVGLAAIIVAVLAGEVAERVRDTETNSTPYSELFSTYDV